MYNNYKLEEQTITNFIKRYIKPIEKQKQIKLIIYYTKFKTSNLIVKNNTNSAKIYLNQTNVVYKFICLFQECIPKNKTNSYIGYTTTTLSHHLSYHLSENSAIKQHFIIKHSNSTNQLPSSDVRKKKLSQSCMNICFEAIHNGSKSNKLKKGSFMKCLVAEKCKSCKIYRIMSDVYRKILFSKKIFTNRLVCLKKVKIVLKAWQTNNGKQTWNDGLVNVLILTDRRDTIEDISEQLEISMGTANKMEHDDLAFSKVSCYWMPKMLMPEYKASYCGKNSENYQVGWKELLHPLYNLDVTPPTTLISTCLASTKNFCMEQFSSDNISKWIKTHLKDFSIQKEYKNLFFKGKKCFKE